MKTKNELVEEFVKDFITNFEPGAFVESKDPVKGLWYISEDGSSEMNLTPHFEMLVEYVLNKRDELLADALQALKFNFEHTSVNDQNRQSDFFNLNANAIDSIEKYMGEK